MINLFTPLLYTNNHLSKRFLYRRGAFFGMIMEMRKLPQAPIMFGIALVLLPMVFCPIDTAYAALSDNSFGCTWSDGYCILGETNCDDESTPREQLCNAIDTDEDECTSIYFSCVASTGIGEAGDEIGEEEQVPLGLSEKIANLYTWAVSLAGLVALSLIIYGGVLFAASAGNPSRITEAKAWITHALIGLFMLLGAYLVLGFINPDLTKLDEVFLAQNVNPQSQTLSLGAGVATNSGIAQLGEEIGENLSDLAQTVVGVVGALGENFSVSPQEWGASINYNALNDPWVPKDKIIIHFGGGPNSAGDPPYSQEKEMVVLRSWEAYHLSKGWRGIAYNYAVGQSGTIYRLRGWNWNAGQYESDDVDYDGISDNNESIAVVFILGGDEERQQAPTPAAIAAFESLRAYIEQATGGRLPLYGHGEVAVSGGHSTNCPGPILSQYVTENR